MCLSAHGDQPCVSWPSVPAGTCVSPGTGQSMKAVCFLYPGCWDVLGAIFSGALFFQEPRPRMRGCSAAAVRVPQLLTPLFWCGRGREVTPRCCSRGGRRGGRSQMAVLFPSGHSSNFTGAPFPPNSILASHVRCELIECITSWHLVLSCTLSPARSSPLIWKIPGK